MSDVARVLVADGGQRSALSVVRSLGRAGHRVYVAAPKTPSLAGSSRHAAEEFPVPEPLEFPERFVEAVSDLSRRWRVDVLLPVTDESLAAVLPERERFGTVRIPYPPAAVFRRVSDKRTLLGVARRVGIAVPEQQVLRSVGDPVADAGALRFPLVVKPSRSVAESDGRRIKLQVRHAADRDALERVLAELPAAAFPVLLQERIEGPGTGVFLLMHEGAPAAVFAHRRIREKPPTGGVSVYRESVRADPELVRRSVRLLSAFGWEGVAMVEYKIDASTGTPYLMEVNGRFWGSLQLAIDAGVDFPALLVRAALGGPLPPPPDYREGARLRWLWGDVDHLLTRLRHPEDGNGNGRRGRFGALADFVGSWRPAERWETLRLSDPRPFLRESVDWMRRL